ncbi:hypothetical protein BKK49_07015 [Rodentibacter rarus]|nr:hypothetical protein BKK49_07015 [Rodentibacter rarus]
MRYSTYINNQKCLDWGLNVNQGALLDYLISIHSNTRSIQGLVVIAVNYQDICNQLPLYYKKSDTVYRALKALISKGLITYHRIDVQNRIEIVSVTEKGLLWGRIYE